jgi:pyridoxine 5-phosphate synthase
VAEIKALGGRAILFIDAEPEVIGRVRDSGADGVEIYTGPYAHAFRDGAHQPILDQIAATAALAREAGLVVNAGHDLNLHNIPPLVAAVPFLAEASIGHELTADALENGWAVTIAAYAAALLG